jgi:hypothetical protein
MKKRRLISFTVVALIASLGVAAQATAGGNETTTYTGQFHESGQIVSDVCGFSDTFTYDAVVKYAFVFDSAGNLKTAITNGTGVATDSANGITLTGQIADNTHFFNGQVAYEVGLVDNLRLPQGGVVQRDVGRIVWPLNGGPPIVVDGPHQSLEGDNATLCAALTP